MSNELIFEAETLESALEQAAEELNKETTELAYEVIDKGSKKLFGFGGASQVKIRIVEEQTEDAGIDSATEETGIAQKVDLGDKSLESLEDAEIDAIADEAISVVTKIASLTGAQSFEIEEFEGEEGEIILDVVGDDLSFLIGRHGRTLEALQTLASAIVTKRVGMRYPISVDVEGYRHRRKQKVIEIAQRAASRAKTQGRSVALKPMTAQERRLCHIAIREISGVESSSEGSGNYRHVVVHIIKG